MSNKFNLNKPWCGYCKCDICGKEHAEFYVDGKTLFGPWALMCPTCFPRHGIGCLGLGLGQKFVLNPDDGKYYQLASKN